MLAETTEVPDTLLVEDDEAIARAFKRLLDRAGLRVCLAATLTQAIRSLHLKSLKVVLLDLQLPDGFGFGILHRIRSHRLPLKVAVVSGSIDGTMEEKLRWLKPDAVFYKPVMPNELLVWTLKSGLTDAVARVR
ncbi:MAG TPA: response regulator [Tepidisphaeraceae bacterium]